MAIVKSKVKMTGPLGNLSMYERDGKIIIRQKGGGSKEKIRTAKSCAPIRESNTEFGACSSISAKMRYALGKDLQYYSDCDMSGNLVGKMKLLIAKGTGKPGSRALDVLSDPDILRGFEFDKQVHFDHCFNAGLDISVAQSRNSAVLQTVFCPARDIQFPEGATSFAVVHTLLRFPRFEKQEKRRQYLPVHLNDSLSAVSELSERYYTDLNLRIKLTLSVQLDVFCSSTGSALLNIVGIAFYKDGQRMKGVNALKIVQVI